MTESIFITLPKLIIFGSITIFMTTFEGTLTKMETEIGAPIQYYLIFDSNFINMNQLINKDIEISHIGYQCLNCNKAKKIWRQGFCYDCFSTIPAAADWIMKPELSTAHLDIEDRDLVYEKRVQLQPHIVYLALSSEVKVGVTRNTQVPTRWIDQGAVQAIPVLETPNRYLAGIAEVALKNHFADKTNWQKMLKNEVPVTNLFEEKNKLKQWLPEETKPYFIEEDNLYQMDFPVKTYPIKVTSLNLEKNLHFSGKVVGIKGQYLIFEDGTVFNVRTYEGFVVQLKF
jgi:hypothetical protein